MLSSLYRETQPLRGSITLWFSIVDRFLVMQPTPMQDGPSSMGPLVIWYSHHKRVEWKTFDSAKKS